MQFHQPTSPVYTIQRGSDLERFNPQNLVPGAPEAMRVRWGVPANVPCFMLPARLTRWKGHFVALHALQRIAEETPAHLVLVGDPQGRDSYLMELEAGIKQAGLEGRVHLVGHCDDMPTAYAAADFILAPSIEPEPFGRTPIEAAAMGRLVIVSNHGGACETVLTHFESPGQATGWRVTPGIIREVAEAMRAALALSAPERDAMGRRARNRVMSQFSLSAMCDATLQVYSDLLRE
jgi:glycosyltransferase involved in cell wall biosynthesis